MATNPEIAELHESCNNYKKMYVDKMEEIKKLRDVIKELEKQLDKTRRDTPWGVARYNMDAIIKKALKESE